MHCQQDSLNHIFLSFNFSAVILSSSLLVVEFLVTSPSASTNSFVYFLIFHWGSLSFFSIIQKDEGKGYKKIK